ncbi:DUF2163 domain-containing protein [Sphingomicrobium sp. XHP0239]|uniref:DUF2163 domain-containing protein n=1 Tax=Sphingomicrobium maritimum TaxID=3133972 RepID=UPI0031CCAD61
MRVSQAGIEMLHRVLPSFSISQGGIEYLNKAAPCVTHLAQIWAIKRSDGETLRFTSLDRDLEWGGQTYHACGSMSPSASENAAEAGSVGNIDLTGLVAAGYVTETDLQGGKYDGARVRAVLVPWKGAASVRVLLDGTFGRVEFDDRSFTVEVTGSGGRLAQTPLVRTMKPGCDYVFGDRYCGRSLDGLIVSGAVETSGDGRNFTDSARSEAAGYFTNGIVAFISGNNGGVEARIKEHGDGGQFTLWPRLTFPIAAGDEYEMTPGCSQHRESDGGTNGCISWDNFVNYGGEPDSPGGDAVARRPDVKK